MIYFRIYLRIIQISTQTVVYPGIFFGRGGSTNSVEDRGQRERGSGGGSPLVRDSGGSCNLVQENFNSYSKIFLNFQQFKNFYDDNQFIFHCKCKKIANLGSFRILLLFFPTSCGAGVLNLAIFKLIGILEQKHSTFSAQFAIRFDFVKNKEFRVGGF